jgi:translation initiation factor 1
VKKRNVDPGAPPFNDAFRGLAERLGIEPAPAPSPVVDGAPREVAAPREAPARAVVRLERKGRGGKEATVVEKLALGPEELARWLKELRKALGCGGSIEGDAIVLQGDLRERVKPLLERRGVRKVTLG